MRLMEQSDKGIGEAAAALVLYSAADSSVYSSACSKARKTSYTEY